MASTGIDRYTGLPLSGLDHVVQCLGVIYTARLGSMVMLRWFGSGLAELLGRRATLHNLALYRQLLALGIKVWEPRLDVVRVTADGTTAPNLRLGDLSFVILCRYRPNALQGDFRVEGSLLRLQVGANDNFTAVTVRRAA